MIPTLTNTLGVALICDLDDEAGSYTIGYNTQGDFTLSALGDGDLDMPAMNQQEGTLTSINKRVNPTNAAIGYGGYELNDIANALGLEAKYIIDYTKELPVEVGFQAQEFDDLPNYYENDGTEVRGYVLENVALKPTGGESVEKFSDDKLEGCIIYLANPVRQFTPFTHKTTELREESGIYMSEEYLSNSDFTEGESVKVKTQHGELVAKIVSDNKIKGDIVVIPTFDKKLNSEALVDGYRFATASIEKV
jgi:NADH-quinone oxidoreductase subunit G